MGVGELVGVGVDVGVALGSAVGEGVGLAVAGYAGVCDGAGTPVGAAGPLARHPVTATESNRIGGAKSRPAVGLPAHR